MCTAKTCVRARSLFKRNRNILRAEFSAVGPVLFSRLSFLWGTPCIVYAAYPGV